MDSGSRTSSGAWRPREMGTRRATMVEPRPVGEAEWDRAVELISTASRLALACHVSPDGDALGSMLAFHLLCLANGKESVASWGDPVDVGPQYRFLPGLELATKPA